MRQRLVLLFILMTLGTSFAQRDGKSYYDTFEGKWINPNKWVATFPQAWGNPLEIVREVRGGQLRLALRNTGNSDKDSGIQWAENELYFSNQSRIFSITTDLTPRNASTTTCPANPDGPAVHLTVGGSFFNSGTGDPQQDVVAVLVVGDASPKTVGVNLWVATDYGATSQSIGIDYYPLGQRLTLYLKWDKANHQFIASVTANGVPTQVSLPYAFADTMPPASPSKALAVELQTQNCTATKMYSYGEALFDNVSINQ
ncbi:MAG TPA: hypothetical protein VMI10_16280 [Terriglobales bacterium]|nr:hypothetical protein [Terriglobales bacterium]